MARDAAWRRGQRQRRRRQAQRIVDAWAYRNEHGRRFYTAEFVARLARTPHPCSCLGCGGHMRFWRGPPPQERRQLAEARVQLGEVT